MIDLSPQQIETVRAILARHVPGCEVRAFGSRVRWTAKSYSDLDLAVLGPKKLKRDQLDALREAFTESDLPFRVDVLDWHAISEQFRTIITERFEAIQQAAKVSTRYTEWELLHLGDLGRIVTGKTPQTAVEGNFGGQIPFVTPSDMDGRKILTTTARNLTEAGAASVKGSRIPAGSVMVSCIGSDMGKAVIAGRDCVTNQQINSIVVGDSFSSEFVYYNLSTRKDEIRHQAAGGSAQPILNKGDFSRLEITLPPLAEQKAIASILGALDDKIELNRRMNATLEAMARALFQSWFVDFDPVRAKLDGREPEGMDSDTAALFPGTFEDSTLGPIPHGWRPAHVEEIASIRTGKRPQGRCDIVSPECNIPLYGGGGRIGYVSFALYDKPILFTGRVGTLGLIFRTAEPSWPSDNTLIVEPHAGHFDFTYFVLKGLDLITLNRGSTQPLVTQTDLKRLMFVLPTKRVFQAFADVSVPLFQQIVSKERESRTLAALRDTLLPKLLSGEMSVVAAEEVAHNPDSHPL